MSTRSPAPAVSPLHAFFGLAVCNVFWGLSFPLMTIINRILDRHAPAADALSFLSAGSVTAISRASLYLVIRFIFATIFLLVLRPNIVRGMPWREWRAGTAVGALFTVGMALQIIGLQEIPASRSAFLTSLTVIFTPILMIALERRLPRTGVVCGSLTAILGTAVLTGVVAFSPLRWQAAEQVTVGDLLTTIGSLFFALFIIRIDELSTRMRAERISPGMFVGVALLSFAGALLPLLSSPDHRTTWAPIFVDRQFLLLTLFMSFVCTLIPFHLMNVYQQYFSPAHASLIYTLEPICATACALFLPALVSPMFGIAYDSESLTLPVAAGGAFIILGNVLALVPPRRSAPVTDPKSE